MPRAVLPSMTELDFVIFSDDSLFFEQKWNLPSLELLLNWLPRSGLEKWLETWSGRTEHHYADVREFACQRVMDITQNGVCVRALYHPISLRTSATQPSMLSLAFRIFSIPRSPASMAAAHS